MNWILQHQGPILTLLGVLLLFSVTVSGLGLWAHRRRKAHFVKGRTCTPPKAHHRQPSTPGTEYYRWVDISVFARRGTLHPEAKVYFYSEEKFVAVVTIIQTLYDILKNDEFYDYDTFESFLQLVYNHVTLRGNPSKIAIAQKLRRSAKKRT